LPKMTVIVEFETVEGREAEFIANMRDHAHRTLHEEPGCLRFELVKPVDGDGVPIPNRIMVNELYDSETALAAHKKNPRMPGLQVKNAPLLKSRRLIAAMSLDIEANDEGLQPDQLNAANDG
jgi:(4S)-4-hydroxy-5-phosphonooxypentane-2,3-dione isomerase